MLVYICQFYSLLLAHPLLHMLRSQVHSLHLHLYEHYEILHLFLCKKFNFILTLALCFVLSSGASEVRKTNIIFLPRGEGRYETIN